MQKEQNDLDHNVSSEQETDVRNSQSPSKQNMQNAIRKVTSIKKMITQLSQPKSMSFSDEIGTYLDGVKPKALKKGKTMDTPAINQNGKHFNRQNCYKPLKFILCEEGVDVASSSQSELDSLQTEEEGDISSISEASSNEEESPLKLRNGQSFSKGDRAPSLNLSKPQGTSITLRTDCDHLNQAPKGHNTYSMAPSLQTSVLTQESQSPARKASLDINKLTSIRSKKHKKSKNPQNEQSHPIQPQKQQIDIVKLLTESEINRIKRNIGNAFRNVLQQAEVKLILKRPPNQRKEPDIDKLVKFLEGYHFLKDQKKLSYADFRELAQSLTFQEYKKDQDVYKYGDKPQHFFIVLTGAVSHLVRNEVIDEWEWAHNIYQALLQWKKDEFDVKVKAEMHKHLLRIKIETDAKQIIKLNSLKPGKAKERSEEVNNLMVGTHIKLMDAIRKDYFKCEAQIKKEQEEQKLKQELLRQKQEEQQEIMKFWKSHTLKKQKSFIDQETFDCERFVDLTKQERKNLQQLKRFRLFKWWVEKYQHHGGACFGWTAFEKDSSEKNERQETITTIEPTSLAVLSKEDYNRVLKKIQFKESQDRVDFLRKIPLFHNLSLNQIRNLSQLATEENFQRHHYIYNQGQTANNVYIVLNGEFEILRNKKNKYSLIDPLKGDLFHQAKHMKDKQMVKLLGPAPSRQRGIIRRYTTTDCKNIGSQSVNNSLFQGERGQGGQIRISIAGTGHMIGWEDIAKNRMCTTTTRCMSECGQLLRIDGYEFKSFLQKDIQIWQQFCDLSSERDQITLGKIKNCKITQANYNSQSLKVDEASINKISQLLKDEDKNSDESSVNRTRNGWILTKPQTESYMRSLKSREVSRDENESPDTHSRTIELKQPRPRVKLELNKTIDINLSQLSNYQQSPHYHQSSISVAAIAHSHKTPKMKNMLLKLPSIKNNDEMASNGSQLSHGYQFIDKTKLCSQAVNIRADAYIDKPVLTKYNLSAKKRNETETSEVKNERIRIKNILGEAERGPWSRETSQERAKRLGEEQKNQLSIGHDNGDLIMQAVQKISQQNTATKKKLQRGQPRVFISHQNPLNFEMNAEGKSIKMRPMISPKKKSALKAYHNILHEQASHKYNFAIVPNSMDLAAEQVTLNSTEYDSMKKSFEKKATGNTQEYSMSLQSNSKM